MEEKILVLASFSSNDPASRETLLLFRLVSFLGSGFAFDSLWFGFFFFFLFYVYTFFDKIPFLTTRVNGIHDKRHHFDCIARGEESRITFFF